MDVWIALLDFLALDFKKNRRSLPSKKYNPLIKWCKNNILIDFNWIHSVFEQEIMFHAIHFYEVNSQVFLEKNKIIGCFMLLFYRETIQTIKQR